MKKSKVRITTVAKIAEEAEKKAEPKLFRFRKRKFIDPSTKLIFNVFKTYEENRALYYKTIAAVFAGRFTNIFAAYDAICK